MTEGRSPDNAEYPALHKRLDKGTAGHVLRYDEFRIPSVSAVSRSEHLKTSFILTSPRVHERVGVAAKAWSTPHVRGTSPPACPLRALYALRGFYVSLALFDVLVSQCFTVTKVSCKIGLSK